MAIDDDDDMANLEARDDNSQKEDVNTWEEERWDKNEVVVVSL